MLRFFRRYGLSCVITLFIFYLSIIPLNNYHGPRFVGQDKLVHLILYISLTMSIARDFYRQSVSFSSRKMIVWAILLPIAYGGLIEILQQNFFPPRTAEWSDWFIDITGILIGFLLARKIYPKFVKKEK